MITRLMTSVLGDNEANSLTLWGPGMLIRLMGVSRLNMKLLGGISACGEAPVCFIISSWLPSRPCSSLVGDGGNGEEEKNVAGAMEATKAQPKKLRDLHHFARARELSPGFETGKMCALQS